MENATKALLIAASVLIVIVLIAVSLKILAPVKETTEDIGKVSGSIGMSIFNSQFTKYHGYIKGLQLIELLDIVTTSNAQHENHKVSVTTAWGITPDGMQPWGPGHDKTTISTIRAAVDVNKEYKINVRDKYLADGTTEGNDGYVDFIEVRKGR